MNYKAQAEHARKMAADFPELADEFIARAKFFESAAAQMEAIQSLAKSSTHQGDAQMKESTLDQCKWLLKKLGFNPKVTPVAGGSVVRVTLLTTQAELMDMVNAYTAAHTQWPTIQRSKD